MPEPEKSAFFSWEINIWLILDALALISVLAWATFIYIYIVVGRFIDTRFDITDPAVIWFLIIWWVWHTCFIGFVMQRPLRRARLRGDLLRDPKFFSRSVSLLRMMEIVFLGLALPFVTIAALAYPFIVGYEEIGYLILYYFWLVFWAAIIATYLPIRIAARARACTMREWREQLSLTLVEPREYFQAFFRVHTTISWFLQCVFAPPLIMLFCAPFFLRFLHIQDLDELLDYTGAVYFLLLGWIVLNALALMFLMSQNFLPWLIRRRVNPQLRWGNAFVDTTRWVLLIQPGSVALAVILSLVCGIFAEFIGFWCFGPQWLPSIVTFCVIGALSFVINLQLFRLLRENWRQAHAAVFAMDGDAEVHQDKKWKMRERLRYLCRLGRPRTFGDWLAQLTVLLLILLLSETLFFCGWGWHHPSMHFAIYTGDEARVMALLDRGYDINHDDILYGPDDLLQNALSSPNRRIARLVLERVDAEAVRELAPYIISTLIFCDRLDMLEEILAKGYDSNDAGDDRREKLNEMLQYLSWTGGTSREKVWAARLLFEYGADVNAATSITGQSPLEYALSSGDGALADEFIAHGATITDAQMAGICANGYRLQQLVNCPDAVKRIIADPNAVDEKGDPWLLRIMGGTPPRSVYKYIQTSSPLPAMSNAQPWQLYGMQPTSEFTMSVELAQILLEDGADVNQRGENERGLTPLCLAVERRDQDAVDWLILNGADMNKRSKEGYAPLHVAILLKDEILVGGLLKQGADPSLGPEDGSGMTMEAFAAQHGTERIQQLFRDALERRKAKDAAQNETVQ